MGGPASSPPRQHTNETAELFPIAGACHVDLYDRDEYVSQAVAKLTEFFDRHLAARERAVPPPPHELLEV
jgi:uncharacterized protein